MIENQRKRFEKNVRGEFQFLDLNLLKYEKDQKFKEEEKDVTMRM